jgi:hypothetical protein
MHSCKNNTGGNISHLQQMVDSFLPYSQEQLGFDKPVKIVFHSDPSNADVLLGKTAHYDPEQFEVYLYTDKRHPKDVMRSLSHEMVHHAQNCRGDFGSCGDTSPGYAQRDPHLRKMEREAYTTGNLIFRDFEDLIKTGKIIIDINFKDSGEPQMSLKEWKDNELNMLLMKKWGLLKETKEETLEEWAPGHEPAGSTHDFLGNPLSSAPKGTKPKSTRWYAGDSKPSEREEPEDEDEALEQRRERQRWRIAHGFAEGQEEEGHPGKSCEEAHPGEKHPVEEGFFGKSADEEREELASAPDDPTRVPEPEAWVQSQTKKRGEWGQKVRGKKGIRGKRGSSRPVGSSNVFSMSEGAPAKISVREAKEITRRIIERIRKEGK